MWNEIYNKIREYDTIIIHRHDHPDGDAMGSQIGLKESIRLTFPEKKVYAVGDATERFRFVGEVDVIDDDIYKDALVIVLDTAETELISDLRFRSGKFLIKIDHHIEKLGYGDLRLVDTTFESCAGLVTYFIKSNGMLLNTYGARALFCGLITDSGRFRYPSTNARTFEMANFLISYGFSTEELYNKLYLEDLGVIKLKAELIMKFKVTDRGVAYLINTKEDVQKYGIDVFGLSRGMVNIMSGIKNINIWVNFTEDPATSKIYVEIRSNGLDINRIATKYGGGGHLMASGATVNNFETVEEVIKDLDKLSAGENHDATDSR